MKYFVTIGTREIEVGIEGENITVAGEPVAATLRASESTPVHLLMLAGKQFPLAVAGRIGDLWSVVMAGAVREVTVVDERTRQIRSLLVSSSGKPRAGVVKAPMPGLVVGVRVVVGEVVTIGQGLIVLEAMKMENELRAPIAGRVTALRVAPGAAVDKGAVLVEISAVEPPTAAVE